MSIKKPYTQKHNTSIHTHIHTGLLTGPALTHGNMDIRCGSMGPNIFCVVLKVHFNLLNDKKCLKLSKPNLLIKSYVAWNRKRVRGSGIVWKRRIEFLKKMRKRVRYGSVYIYI